MKVETGFSLGSNLGDRLALLRAMRDRLAATPGAALVAQSPVYETEPVGVKPQYARLKYLNAVVILTGEIAAEAWLRRAAEIEAELGRVRTEDRYAPRTADIDLLYHGDDHFDDSGLTLPHPRWTQRLFVVRPLADVRPDLILPGDTRRIRDHLERLAQGAERIELFAATW